MLVDFTSVEAGGGKADAGSRQMAFPNSGTWKIDALRLSVLKAAGIKKSEKIAITIWRIGR
jgi:hypothetical protein